MAGFVEFVAYFKLLVWPLTLIAAVSGIWAAYLWLEASRIDLPPFDPPIASMSNAPELHILDITVRQNEAFNLLALSSKLNAKAARWSGLAAFLTALSVLFGLL